MNLEKTVAQCPTVTKVGSPPEVSEPQLKIHCSICGTEYHMFEAYINSMFNL